MPRSRCKKWYLVQRYEAQYSYGWGLAGTTIQRMGKEMYAETLFWEPRGKRVVDTTCCWRFDTSNSFGTLVGCTRAVSEDVPHDESEAFKMVVPLLLAYLDGFVLRGHSTARRPAYIISWANAVCLAVNMIAGVKMKRRRRIWKAATPVSSARTRRASTMRLDLSQRDDIPSHFEIIALLYKHKQPEPLFWSLMQKLRLAVNSILCTCSLLPETLTQVPAAYALTHSTSTFAEYLYLRCSSDPQISA